MFNSTFENEKLAAAPYKNNDFGLFEAISDGNKNAVLGLIKYYNHNVNCYASGGGYNGLKYAATPTPLSYAISFINPEMVSLLISLGADKTNYEAIACAKRVKSKQINELLGLTQQPSNANDDNHNVRPEKSYFDFS